MISTIIILAIIFVLMISLHEFGHFIFGVLFGFNITEYAIGFGPKVFSRVSRKTNIRYSIRLLPIGGFCAFAGEDKESSDPNDFMNKPAWQRLIITAAGGVFNIIMGLAAFAVLFSLDPKVNSTKVESVFPNSYLAESGIQKGDEIIAVNGKRVYSYTDLQTELINFEEMNEMSAGLITGKDNKSDMNKEQFVDITYKHNSDTITERIQMSVMTEIYSYDEEYIDFSMAINDTVIDSRNYIYETGEAVYNESKIGTVEKSYSTFLGFTPMSENITVSNFFPHVLKESASAIKMVYKSLSWLLSGKLSLDAMSGPIGIVSAMNVATENAPLSDKLLTMLNLMALLSFNLGIFNLLPIPALDGGRIVFNMIEIIRRKPVPVKVENTVHTVGMTCLYVLMAFVTVNDIYKILIR